MRFCGSITLAFVIAGIVSGDARADARHATPAISAIHITVTAEDRGATPTKIDAVRAITSSAFDRADVDLGSRVVALDLAVVETRAVYAQRRVDVAVKLRLCVTDPRGRMLAVVTAGATASGGTRIVVSTLREQAIRDAMTGLVDQLRAMRRPAAVASS